jgi:hypothetical protein
MKNYIYFLSFLALSSCGVILNAEKVFIENSLSSFTNVDDAIASKKGQLVFLVFYENESNLYNSPVTKVLKFDTTKSDALNYRSLCDEYAVVKLYRSEYEWLMNNLTKYNTVDSLKEEGLAYNPGKAFMFICSPQRLCLYGELTLDSPKAEIHEQLWVFMGP